MGSVLVAFMNLSCFAGGAIDLAIRWVKIALKDYMIGKMAEYPLRMVANT